MGNNLNLRLLRLCLLHIITHILNSTQRMRNRHIAHAQSSHSACAIVTQRMRNRHTAHAQIQIGFHIVYNSKHINYSGCGYKNIVGSRENVLMTGVTVAAVPPGELSPRTAHPRAICLPGHLTLVPTVPRTSYPRACSPPFGPDVPPSPRTSGTRANSPPVIMFGST